MKQVLPKLFKPMRPHSEGSSSIALTFDVGEVSSRKSFLEALIALHVAL